MRTARLARTAVAGARKVSVSRNVLSATALPAASAAIKPAFQTRGLKTLDFGGTIENVIER